MANDVVVVIGAGGIDGGVIAAMRAGKLPVLA
ncbi:MAG: hypothetical protein JWQ16_2629 [Novosphingobium sp.]|nr:hypothetical protein [Novosphingobium sp.]